MSLPKTVAAIESYVPLEIPVMKAQNVNLILLDENAVIAQQIKHDQVDFQPSPTEAILRSPRLAHDTYQYLYETLQRRNIILINTPEMVRRASEFELHYPLIEKATPRSLIVSANVSPRDLYEEIQRTGLRLPLFVKTEIKSLKSGSVIEELSVNALDTVLNNLRTQLSGFFRIIVREMIELERLSDYPDTALEYRAFVLHNQIIIVQDGTEGKPSPPIVQTGGDRFYKEWIDALARANFSNFYIMDIARSAKDRDFVIIEIKDGQYTKIRDVDAFWRRI